MSDFPDLDRCGCQCGKPGCVSRRKSGVVKHGASGYGMGCRCDVCTRANVRKTSAKRARLNAQTLDTATRRYQPWTGAELEIITRTDLTAREAAVMVGRTMSAVKNMRSLCRTDPKFIALLGASNPRE